MARHVVRIFCEKINDKFQLSEEQTHRIVNVMRLKNCDEFLAFNETDGEWSCRISQINKNSINCVRQNLIKNATTTLPRALAFCLIKPDAMKLIIEKCTELGITDFYPIISEYTQLKNCNLDKLKLIAMHATEQSERFCIPQIHQITNLRYFIQNSYNFLYRIFPHSPSSW